MVVYTNRFGEQFTQIFQVFPSTEPLFTQYEKDFSGEEPSNWTRDNLWISLVLVTLYVIFCFGGKALMKDRVAFDLKPLLALWNLGLSVFSILGALHTVPVLLWHLSENGLYYTVCTPPRMWYGMGSAGFWTMLFIFSKVPELFDTAFIVMRKKKLIFLHWYHHVTVLLYCWHSYATRSSAGIWFISMNYSVHAVMYFYYFLSAIGIRVSWAPLVTVFQISQMFVGVTVCVLIVVYQNRGDHCAVTDSNQRAGVLMYFSYFCLFVHFAYLRFCAPRKKKEVAVSKKEE